MDFEDVYQVQVSNFGEDSKDAIATSKVILGLESFSGQRNLHVKRLGALFRACTRPKQVISKGA